MKNYNYAGFGRRLLAYFVDGGILFFINSVIQNAYKPNFFKSIINAESLEQMEMIQNSSSYGSLTWIGFALSLLYMVIFWVHYDGATPGKRLMAIKITKDDGSKVDYPAAIIRYLSELISFVFLGLGVLWIIWDKRKQAWHDKIAKTIVVKTEKEPRTGLAIFISLIIVIGYVLFLSIFIYKGIKLGLAENGNSYGGKLSMTRSKKEMDKEAKVYFDKSQELFKKMRLSTDVIEITRLNDENIESLKEASELDPENDLIWMQLGHAYTWISSDGSLDDSLSAYKIAESLDPENVNYINFVGDTLLQLERFEEAVLQFKKALRIYDESAYAHQRIGVAYARLGIYEKSAEHLEKAINIYEGLNDDGIYDNEILKTQKDLAEVNKVM
jgi:uncharacterized RDD family membrane protein YckC